MRCAVNGLGWRDSAARSFVDRYYCPKHTDELFDGFDPQPGDRVGIMDYRWPVEYRVVGRVAETLFLEPVGKPEDPLREVPVWDSYPVGTWFSVSCGA